MEIQTVSEQIKPGDCMGNFDINDIACTQQCMRKDKCEERSKKKDEPEEVHEELEHPFESLIAALKSKYTCKVKNGKELKGFLFYNNNGKAIIGIAINNKGVVKIQSGKVSKVLREITISDVDKILNEIA